MAYSVKTSPSFRGVTLADDRFASFEAIRDANDPDMKDRRAASKPLTDQDYFGTLPEDSSYMLHQKRLHTLVMHAKRKEEEEQKAAENSRKEAAKLSF
ncbi:MAG: hypothetical protein AB7I18_11270 [Candidatus Berkiella sp.]